MADAGEEGGGLLRVASGGGSGTEVRLWMWGGDANSWAGGSCVPSSVGSVDKIRIPFNGASLELILIWASSERCVFFGMKKMSARGRPLWERSMWFVSFLQVLVDHDGQ